MPEPDRTWAEQFTMQMTIQKAQADEIDKALADVRSHCVESGESAYEAFGEPKGYATTLAAELPTASSRPSVDFRRIGILLPLIWGPVLLQIPLWAPAGSNVPVSVGHVLLVAVVVPAWVVLTARWLRRLPRDPRTPNRAAFDEKGWRSMWLTLGLAAVGAAFWLAFDQVMFTTSRWGLIGLVCALLAIGLLLSRLLTVRPTS
ncbi:hypothetical protein ABZ814_25380 [Micromonospora musae]|uniref:hypothetical protein n=1 Tax=Micromonospora musae TaxID=1894970 RepID=UPI0034051081